jgi:5-methylcytosine-specific restriction endonuclease McrA
MSERPLKEWELRLRGEWTEHEPVCHPSIQEVGRSVDEILGLLPGQRPPGRRTRHIPQSVKVQVAALAGGRCHQCGSTAEPQFDHVQAWSRGGANDVSNIQLLCGPGNRRKGAR